MKSILLLHGWNYKNYTKLTTESDAWHNRKNFVNELSKKYKVYKLNFPGFCGEKEYKKAWELDDYAKYVNDYIVNNNLDNDYILGYSFGGAVALRYNTLYKTNKNIILISPAIIRNKSNSKKYINTFKLLNPLRNIIRNFYVSYIIKNNEMYYGTRFLKNTYQNIVREELINEVYNVDKNKLLIIYGIDDNMVLPHKVYDCINKDYKESIKFIDGGHDIANENYEKIIEVIEENNG